MNFSGRSRSADRRDSSAAIAPKSTRRCGDDGAAQKEVSRAAATNPLSKRRPDAFTLLFPIVQIHSLSQTDLFTIIVSWLYFAILSHVPFLADVHCYPVSENGAIVVKRLL